ncbi:mitochondrial basic amino acids transporter-like [Limulus polyphemus]|uniref:Mitochondrial basic amino acids transporter-like n=1 Tax=Limulus polyphemus TaxID=6850 RepID=A0ABM1BW48_LIMPO|nr:mitochondrial basic amino acids transporter-like [Limulus polyphemus]
MSSPMCSLAFINAILFGVQGNVQRCFSDPSSITSHMIGGAAAGAVQSVITSPMELAKTRMQLQGQHAVKTRFLRSTEFSHSYSGPTDCLMKLFRTEGTRGIFRGLSCTILRDCPGFAIYFGAYELFIRLFSNTDICGLMIAGGLAGIISWISIYPLDLVKSRLQADGTVGPHQFNGIIDCTTKTYRREGLKAFTQGLNSTILRAFPTNAAIFFTVSWVTKFCENTKDKFEFSADRNAQSLPLEENTDRIICFDK